ncbi:toprim domain-containing protein [Muriicola sp. SD30]|uniref:toprim domain-containing protein n=1 Tax=Muriicola sp. SD30 TaxID=3240936 RepID=UPI003510686B
MKKERMDCERARTLCLITTLARAGHFPVRETEKEAWYLSPFRSETQASFKVNKKINRWYDHGEGIGGNIIDVVCQLENCTVSKALKLLSTQNPSFSFHQLPSIQLPDSDGSKIKIIRTTKIRHAALRQYLKSRYISLETAQKLCKEVHYRTKGKTYFAIGLENVDGGWELRNKYWKNSTSPKTISIFKNGHKKLIITEGMFDMLSLLELIPNIQGTHDFLILNSTAFIEKALVQFKYYDQIDLFLDNDGIGKEKTGLLLKQSHNTNDNSHLYDGFKDMNEWLIGVTKECIGQGIQDVFLLPQKQSCFAPDGCKEKIK